MTQDAESVARMVPEEDLAIAHVEQDRLRDALREALELVEDYAQYCSPFLLQKWGHADDLARLKAVLNDGQADG